MKKKKKKNVVLIVIIIIKQRFHETISPKKKRHGEAEILGSADELAETQVLRLTTL